LPHAEQTADEQWCEQLEYCSDVISFHDDVVFLDHELRMHEEFRTS